MNSVPVYHRNEVYTPPVNKVLRNTYSLLTLMLLASAVAAAFSLSRGVQLVSPWLFLIFVIGMPFAINAFRNSVVGLGLSFVYAGLLGYFVGPVIGIYARIDPSIPLYAFAGTAAIFGALTVYAMTTKRDLSFMRGFLVVGTVAAVLAIVAVLLFNLPTFSVVLSAALILLSGGWILYLTQSMVRGGEHNYIVLATALFGSIWSLFLNLMRLLAFFQGED